MVQEKRVIPKTCRTCINVDGGVCTYAGEVGSDYTCDKWESVMTCSKCEDVGNCEFAYDDYNTNGDCLAIK